MDIWCNSFFFQRFATMVTMVFVKGVGKMPLNSYNGNGNFVIRTAKMGIFLVQPTPRNQMCIVDRLSFPPSSLENKVRN